MAKKKDNPIREVGVRPPQIPRWSARLLDVMAKTRGQEKQFIISTALAAMATKKEVEQSKQESDQ